MDPRLPALAALALVATAALPATAPAAAPKPGTFSGALGLKVPKGASASVRAISRATGTVAASRDVGRSGRFSLTLPAGTYLVVGTVVPKNGKGKVAQRRIGVSLKAGQKRRKASLKARRRKTRRKAGARAAYIQERGQVTPGRIAVEIPPLTGNPSGEWKYLKGGVDDLMIVDVVGSDANCDVAVIEVERRAEILKELEFQQSPYVDPSTRTERNFALGDVEVRGTMEDAGGGNAVVRVKVIDKATGKQLGGAEQVLRPETVFDDLERLSGKVIDELCKLSDVYEVTMDVKDDATFATHAGSGTIHAVLRARRKEKDRPVWRDAGPLQWSNVSFTSKTPRCPMVDPVVPVVEWSVTILDVGGGNLQVTWVLSGNDMTTASIDCLPDPQGGDPPPQPGLPGPALLGTQPESFLIPYAGGSQPLSGNVSDGGDGFFNTGSITVKPAGVAAR